MAYIIRFLTQHFYPDTSSTGNLLTELAVGLAKRGYAIEVFTFKPLHFHKEKIVLPKFEVYKSIKIFRFSGYGFGKNSKLGKAYNYISYFSKAFLKVQFTSHRKNRYLYFIVSNPPFLPLIGSFLNYLKKIEFIHLLYDVHPEQSIAVNYLSEKNVFVKIWKWSTKFIYKRAAHTIVLSEEMRETVVSKLKYAKASQSKFNAITIIDNWADDKFFIPVDYSQNKFIVENNLSGKFIVNYSGNIGIAQRFDSLMRAAEIIDDNEIIFIFVGDGVKRKGLEDAKQKKNLKNVLFFPYQSKEVLPHLQAASHLSVVHLEKEIEGFAFPSKLYTVLAAGTPVLALCSESSRLARIVKEAECGYSAQHENVNELVNKIKELKNNPALINKFRKNARRYFEENYTLEKALDKYENIFKSFIKI